MCVISMEGWWDMHARSLAATQADMLQLLTVGAVIRMMMDQLLFAPFFLSTFIASLMTLEVRMHSFALPPCDAC